MQESNTYFCFFRLFFNGKLLTLSFSCNQASNHYLELYTNSEPLRTISYLNKYITAHHKKNSGSVACFISANESDVL